jgi:hypothetical protein
MAPAGGAVFVPPIAVIAPLVHEELAIVRGVEQIYHRAITGRRPECAGCLLQEFSEEVGQAALLILEPLQEHEELHVAPICKDCMAHGPQVCGEKILRGAIERAENRANHFFTGGTA